MNGGIMKYLILLFALFALSSVAFSEEERLNTELKLVLGTSAFLDEEIPFDHFLAGGSMRFYLTKRLSVEPQFLYMKGPGSDRDYTLTGNVGYDLAVGKKYAVYAAGGAGLLRHTERFQTGNFSVNDWTANGGIGVRLFVSEKFFVAPEFRFGWEPLLTTQIGIRYSF